MSFPTELQNLLNDGRASLRSFVKLELGEGDQGLWNGNFEIEVSGVTYYPNSVMEISEPVYGLGTAAASFTIELSAKRDFGLTPDKLAQVEDYDYKGRVLVVYDGWFNPDTRELLHLEPMVYGYIDTIDHVKEGVEKKLVVNVISGAIDNHRDGYRQASHEDQQLVLEGDLFFEHADRVQHEEFEIEL